MPPVVGYGYFLESPNPGERGGVLKNDPIHLGGGGGGFFPEITHFTKEL